MTPPTITTTRTYLRNVEGLQALLMDRDSSSDEKVYDTTLCRILDVVQHLRDGSISAGLADSQIDGLWVDASTDLDEDQAGVVGLFENAFHAGQIPAGTVESDWADQLLTLVAEVLDQEQPA